MSPELKMILSQMQQDLREVKSDVKDLQGFRWKTAGIATACSFIIGLVIKVYFK